MIYVISEFEQEVIEFSDHLIGKIENTENCEYLWTLLAIAC